MAEIKDSDLIKALGKKTVETINELKKKINQLSGSNIKINETLITSDGIIYTDDDSVSSAISHVYTKLSEKIENEIRGIENGYY